MNLIDKIFCKIFPPCRFKIIRREQNLILRAVIDSLPVNFNDFKSQIQSLTFHGITDWNLFPDYKFVYFSYPGNTINEYKKRGQNHKISGIQIFSNKTKKYESIEILVNDNLLSGLKISNSDYFLDEFDLKKINSEKTIISNFDFYQPPNNFHLPNHKRHKKSCCYNLYQKCRQD